MDTVEFDIGDKVIVQDGITDPDFDITIEGWTGEIIEVDSESESRILYRIEWDDITLKKMSEKHIDTCDRENLDHTCMSLFGDEIELQPEIYDEKQRKFLGFLNRWVSRG